MFHSREGIVRPAGHHLALQTLHGEIVQDPTQGAGSKHIASSLHLGTRLNHFDFKRSAHSVHALRIDLTGKHPSTLFKQPTGQHFPHRAKPLNQNLALGPVDLPVEAHQSRLDALENALGGAVRQLAGTFQPRVGAIGGLGTHVPQLFRSRVHIGPGVIASIETFHSPPDRPICLLQIQALPIKHDDLAATTGQVEQHTLAGHGPGQAQGIHQGRGFHRIGPAPNAPKGRAPGGVVDG